MYMSTLFGFRHPRFIIILYFPHIINRNVLSLYDIYIHMKLIITENKRNKVVTSWLNKYYSDLFTKEYPRWDIIDFFTTDGPGSKVFIYDNRVLLISNSNLKDELNAIFNVDNEDLNDIFIPFMKDNYNLNVISVKYL